MLNMSSIAVHMRDVDCVVGDAGWHAISKGEGEDALDLLIACFDRMRISAQTDRSSAFAGILASML